MKKIIFLFILLLNIQNALGNSLITGIIKDAETNEPLPIANIYIKDTFIGTISNIEGNFKLEIPKVPAEIVVSYIGYETKKIVIKKEKNQNLNILLNPIAVKMKEVVVYSDQEDPAIGIMRKVIANKIKWKNKLKSFRAKAYTRSKVENENSIVSISESVSKLYWEVEKGSREEFIAKKTSKRMSYLTDMSVGAKNILNFSDDNIMLMTHKFVGPTNPETFDYYDFKLTGERKLNNKIVYDIKVLPKSKLQPLFSGRISVLDEDFAMIDVDLKNSGNMNFSAMLKYFRGNYKQQFSNFGKEFWLPIDSRVEEYFEVDMGILSFPKAMFNKISRISNYEINVDVSSEITRIDTTIVSKQNSAEIFNNKSAFEKFENVPLTKKEVDAYTNPDTTMTLIKSFPPKGVLAPYLIKKEDELEDALSEQGSYTPIKSSADIGFQFWYNRVEGLNLGLKYDYLFKNQFIFNALTGYQTYAKKFFYDIKVKYLLRKNDKNKYFYVGYYDKTDTRYSSEHYSQLVTSLLPLFGKRDYFDYYSNKKFSTGINYGIKEIKSELFFGFNRENHSSLNQKFNCRILNKNYRQRLNPPIDEGQLNSIKLRLGYNQAYNAIEIEKIVSAFTNKIELEIEHSSTKYLKSDFDFTQYKFAFDYTLKTFFKRRPDYNYLRTRIEATTYTGDLPLQRFSIIDGSLLSYSPFGIFKTFYNKPLEGEKKFAFFYEHNFKSIPFEMLGLKYFARNKYELILHCASGRTWIDQDRLNNIKNTYKPIYKNEFQNEVGIGIMMKFQFFSVRLDATRNLNIQKNYTGFSLNLIGMSF